MSPMSSSEALKKRWTDLDFFPNTFERALARIWPTVALIIFAPLLIVPLFMSGRIHDHLIATANIFGDGFVLTLSGAIIVASFFISHWQRAMRSTFGGVVEAGIVPDDEQCLHTYSKLSSELPCLMGSYWRYVICLALLIVVACANQGPISETYSLLIERHPLDFGFAENIAILSMLLLLSYAGGVTLWSLLASAIWMSRFSKSTCLKLQLGHSDNCCGLGDVGLCSLQSALPLLVGMVLLVLWAYGGKLQWFVHLVNEDFLEFLQKYIFGLLVLLFALAVAQVFLPVSALHKKMLDAKQTQDKEYCRLVEGQLEQAKGGLASEDETTIKVLSDRLKLVQSFDPVVLKISTWPFDRAVLVTYGITPILALFTPLVNGYLHRLDSAETNRAVLLVTANGSSQFLPERSTVFAYVTLTNIGKTAALHAVEANIAVHSETVEDSCFTIIDRIDTNSRALTILPGATETLAYDIVVGPECADDFKSLDPIPTVTISSEFNFTDKFGTKGTQEFLTVIANPRSVTSVRSADAQKGLGAHQRAIGSADRH